jgi:transposase
LQRSAPVLPMMPGMPERRTHDYLRNGVTTLFAAFDAATGDVITAIHRRHRAIEFKKFLTKIDQTVPEDLDVHLICDNYGTHKTPAITAWLARHPRFHMHFTPTYSSWINQVERWFGLLTDKKIRRSAHRSVQALEADIRAWTADWNTHPKPFIWTKTAEQIPRVQCSCGANAAAVLWRVGGQVDRSKRVALSTSARMRSTTARVSQSIWLSPCRMRYQRDRLWKVATTRSPASRAWRVTGAQRGRKG